MRHPLGCVYYSPYRADCKPPLEVEVMIRTDPTGLKWIVDLALPLTDADKQIISQAEVDYANA